MLPKKRKNYLGPHVLANAKLPKTSEWRLQSGERNESLPRGVCSDLLDAPVLDSQNTGLIPDGLSTLQQPLATSSHANLCDANIVSVMRHGTSVLISGLSQVAAGKVVSPSEEIHGTSDVPSISMDLTVMQVAATARFAPHLTTASTSLQQNYQQLPSSSVSIRQVLTEPGDFSGQAHRAPAGIPESGLVEDAVGTVYCSSSSSSGSNGSSLPSSICAEEDLSDCLSSEEFSEEESDGMPGSGESSEEIEDANEHQGQDDQDQHAEQPQGDNAEQVNNPENGPPGQVGQDLDPGEAPPPDDHADGAQYGQAGNNYNENPSHPKLRRRMHGDFEPPIETLITASRNDALYMALGLARRENFSNSALCNAILLINALFAVTVLPSTVDLLDALLVSNLGVMYFFFCRSCSKFFGQLNYKTINTHVCPNQNCGVLNIISDLRVAHFFVIFDVPHQLQNMLQNPEVLNAVLTPAEAAAKSRPGFISDIWDGTAYQAFALAVSNLPSRVFSFHFCVDGSPLVISSLLSIWPILLALNELPPLLRMSQILLGGLWFGKKPAKMDLFLAPLVSHFRTLSEGFYIKMGANVEHARAFCTGCCVDSGARGKVQGVKTHSGYHSCNWCTICGEWIGGAVRFPLTMERSPDRTHAEIVALQHRLMDNPLPAEGDNINLEDEEAVDPGIPEEERDLLGVNAVSPLINLPHVGQGIHRIPSFNMVTGFFVDSMHMLDLGISKYFLARWLEDYGHDYYILDSSEMIDRRIDSLQPPKEFRRKPRKLFERPRFNAREFNNWMMFCCVPVLTGILQEKYIKTWLLLIQALYLLSQVEVSALDLNNADILINLFLVQTQEYYDECDMSFNLHILKHLTAHTYINGPLSVTNAYCFENKNGDLKKVVHSSQGVPHQIIRSLSWAESSKILEGVVSQRAKDYVTKINQTQHEKQKKVVVGNVRLIGKTIRFHLSPEEEYQCELHEHLVGDLSCYAKLVYENCSYTDNCNRSKRFDNSIAQLTNKNIVLIRRIFLDSRKNKVFLLVSSVNFETVLVPPVGVELQRDFHFMRKISSINEEIRYIKSSELKVICFRASMPHGDFLAPFPNVYNRH